MTVQDRFLFFARRLIENGVPEISCPNCGYKISGWLAMKIRREHTCFDCGKTFKVLEFKKKGGVLNEQERN